MSPKSLYDLVRSLDEKQRSEFRSWVKSNTRSTKGKLKFVLLFDRLLEHSEYDEGLIRRKYFLNASAFYKTRDLLLNKIIECFAQKGEVVANDFQLIKTALHFGAMEYAQKKFQESVKVAINTQDHSELLRLALLRDSCSEDYSIQLDQFFEFPPSTKYLKMLDLELQANSLIRESRHGFGNNISEKRWIAEKIERLIHSAEFEPLKGGFLYQKLRVHREFLVENFRIAAKNQLNLAEALISRNIQARVPQILKNISNAITSSFILEDREKAIYYSMQLSKVETSNWQQEKMKKVIWMKRTIQTGFAFGEVDLLESGSKQMLKAAHLVDEQTFARYLFRAALGFLTIGMVEEGHTLLQRLDNSPRRIRKHLPWQIDILSLIFHLEKENWDYLHAVIDSKKQKFKEEPYWKLVLKAIEAIVFAEGEVNQRIKDQYSALQAELVATGASKKHHFEFDLRLFLTAKFHDQTIHETYLNESEQKMMPVAL